MIYGSIHHEDTYSFLPPRIRQALDFARMHDLGALPTGRCEIAGDDVYVNIAHYTTGERSEKIWEAHRAYIDIHVLAAGTEKIDVSLIERMETHPYEADKDYVPADGAVTQTTIMRPGDFLVCFPEDVHRSGVKVDAPAPLKKGIFKVRV